MKHKPKSFSNDGRNFTVRAIPNNAGWVVRVFEGEQHATYVFYTVSYETQVDVSMRCQGLDLVEDLMQLAQKDVEQNRVNLTKIE